MLWFNLTVSLRFSSISHIWLGFLRLTTLIRKCSSLLKKGTITERQRSKRWLTVSRALSWEWACFHRRVAVDILISEASRQLYPPFRGAARADNRRLNGWCISHKHCGLVVRGKVSEIMVTYATHRKMVMVQRNICHTYTSAIPAWDTFNKIFLTQTSS